MAYCLGEGHTPTYRERKPRGWTQAYHSNFNILAEQAFPIWASHSIDLPVWSSWASSKRTLGLSWESLLSAKIIYTVTSEVWPSWGSLWLNGSKILDFDFRLGGGTVSNIIDITGLVLQGSNEFMFKAEKAAWIGWGKWFITMNLVLDGVYSVETPNFWDDWPEWWPYAAGGLGMAAIGGAILLSKRGKGGKRRR